MALEVGMCTCGNCRWCRPDPSYITVTPAPTSGDPPAYVLSPYTFTPYEPRLSDEDVERIARRVAELLRGEGTR